MQSLRYEAERGRDGLQREAASLDSQLHISNARLNEAHTEIRNLTGRQVLLQNRIEELEKVIEQLRAQEFRSRALVAQEQGSDPDSLLAVQVRTHRASCECSYCECTCDADARNTVWGVCRRGVTGWSSKRLVQCIS